MSPDHSSNPHRIRIDEDPAAETIQDDSALPTLPIDVEVELAEDDDTDPDATLATSTTLAPPEAEPDTLPGTRVGRYKVEREIGRGGMGVVYRAFDRDLRRHVAMKVLHQVADKGVAHRFVEEAQTTAQLQHPAIVPVYEMGLTPDKRLYFTMKLVKGRTLAEVIEAVRGGDERLAREFTRFRLLEIFVDACRSVAYAHARGVVHRDLKPQNLMIGRHAEVQVLDWGVAKILEDLVRASRSSANELLIKSSMVSGRVVQWNPWRGGTACGALVGTPAYMSPEQAEGEASRIGPCSDIFALGGILYHLLTGRPPFAGTDSEEVLERAQRADFPRPRELDPSIPRPLQAICLHAMAAEPQDRYGSARAMADEVQAFLEGRTVNAYSEGLAERVLRVARRHRAATRILIAGLWILTVASLVGVVVLQQARLRAERNEARARDNADTAREQALAADRARQHAILEAFNARLQVAEGLTDRARGYLKENRTQAAAACLLRAIEIAPPGGHPQGFEPTPANPGWARQAWLLYRYQAPRQHTEQRRFKGHAGRINDLAFSQDGEYLVTASGDGSAALWEVASGLERRRFEQHGDDVNCVAVDPLNRLAATGGNDAVMRVWLLETGRQLQAFEGHAKAVTDAAFLPDGERLVSASRDGTIRLWKLGENHPQRVFEGHRDWVLSLAVSPGGRRLLSGSGDHTVRLWDLEAGELITTLEGHEAAVEGVLFGPRGRRAISASQDRTIRLWAVPGGQELRRFVGHEGGVLSVALSPDGKYLISGSSDQTIRQWERATGREVARFEGHAHFVNSVAVHPDGRRLAAGYGDHTAGLWRLRLEEPFRLLDGHEARVHEVKFSRDGRFLASASADGSARVWRAVLGTGAMHLPHPHEVMTVAFDASGDRLLSGDSEGLIRLWSWRHGKVERKLSGHEGAVNSVSVSPSGRRLASGSSDGTARIWKLPGGEPLQLLEGHEAGVHQVVFSPDERLLATASGDKTIGVWEVSSGELVRRLEGHGYGVREVHFTPDARYLVSSGSDRTVRLWEVATGRELRRWVAHTYAVQSLELAPDGQVVATGAWNDSVWLWDLFNARKLRALPAPPGELASSLAISPGGRLLAIAADDEGRLELWQLLDRQTPENPPRLHPEAANPYEEFDRLYRRIGMRVIREGPDRGSVVPFERVGR